MQFIGYDADIEAIYRHRGRIIRVPANQGDLPAQLTAAYAAVGLGETAQTYAEVFLANRAKIFDAISTLGSGWLALYVNDTTAPTLAQKRTLLGSVLVIVLTFDTALINSLTVERLSLGLPGAPVSAWTAANCDGWHTLLSGWLGRAMALLAAAMVPGSTD